MTNLQTGKSAVVTIRDRGPHVKGRIIDLSPATARLGRRQAQSGRGQHRGDAAAGGEGRRHGAGGEDGRGHCSLIVVRLRRGCGRLNPQAAVRP